MITDYPLAAALFFAVFFMGLGAWLDRIVVAWKLDRLRDRIYRLRVELRSGKAVKS